MLKDNTVVISVASEEVRQHYTVELHGDQMVKIYVLQDHFHHQYQNENSKYNPLIFLTFNEQFLGSLQGRLSDIFILSGITRFVTAGRMMR